MADCAQLTSSTVGNYSLRNRSAIFDAVRSMLTVATDEASDVFLSPPPFRSINLNVPVGNQGAAQLEDVNYVQPGMPTADLTGPDLEKVMYDAVVGTVDLGFSAGVIGDVNYQSGYSHVPLPSARPDTPPLDYPQESQQSLPDAPTVGGLAVPVLAPGQKPELTPIKPLVYTPSGLEPLDPDEFPSYEPPEVDNLQWRDELKYHDDQQLRSKLRDLMAGGDEAGRWISGLVQEKLYRSGVRGLNLQTKRQIDQQLITAAGRNFSMPIGAVDAAVAEIAGDKLEKSYEVAQQVGDEVYQAAIDAVTEAISRSVQVEQYHFRLYMRYVRQNLRVYRRNIELATEVYNTLVGIYNDAARAVRIRIQAYNQFIQAISAENRAFAAAVDIREAEVQTYQARVMMFASDTSLLRKASQVQQADVEQRTLPLMTYQSDLKGHMANLEIIQQNLDGFRQSIDAYSQYFQWYDDAIGAFDSATDAETSKITVNTNKFDAYRQLWSAEQDRASSFRDYVGSSFSVFDDEMRRFRQAVSAQQSYLSAVNQSLSHATSAVSSHQSVVSTIEQHANDYNAARITHQSASDGVGISAATTKMADQAISSEADAHYARLDTAREAAKLTAAGALSQAASAIFQVSVSADGSASERVSGRDSGDRRYSVQDRKSFTRSCTEVVRPAQG